MTLNKIKPENINKEIKVSGLIAEIKPPEPVITNATFQCKSCMRINDMKQDIHEQLTKPAVCQECGGHTFKLDPEKCEYTEKQEITLYHDKRSITIYMRGNLCGYDYKRLNRLTVNGILRVKINHHKPNKYYIDVTAVLKT